MNSCRSILVSVDMCPHIHAKKHGVLLFYQKQGAAANNFLQTMPVNDARKAVGIFKDEYLLVSMKWKLISLKMLLKGL